MTPIPIFFSRPEVFLFAYILTLFLVGASLLWAGKSDFAAGNNRDGKLMFGMGLCSLVAGGAIFAF